MTHPTGETPSSDMQEKARFLRQLTAADVEREGPMASVMVRGGLLLDILDTFARQEAELPEGWEDALKEALYGMKWWADSALKSTENSAVRRSAQADWKWADEKLERLASSPQPPVSAPEGYAAAFYEIGEMLGLPAMTASPREVWETVMRPKLAALIAAAPKSPELEDK